jgi:hypothetical protein
MLRSAALSFSRAGSRRKGHVIVTGVYQLRLWMNVLSVQC